MIYVYLDGGKIPNEWLAKAAALTARLEGLATKEERAKLINTNNKLWSELKDVLLAMSCGKCWYSEAPDAVSDFHVDHFRPKGKSVDEDGKEYDGYQWLAFNWENYRIAGSYPNSPHKDGSGVVRGKWDYFPLAKGSSRASWSDRDTKNERYLLLDPTNEHDPKLLTFDETGLPKPSDPTNPIARKKVELTTRMLFLDSPRLVAARKAKWREVLDWLEEYLEVCPKDYDNCTPQDHARFTRHLDKVSRLTSSEAAYSATARACLRANGMDFLIQGPEHRRGA